MERLPRVWLLRRELWVFGTDHRKLSLAHLNTGLLAITDCRCHECTACHTLVNNPLRLVTTKWV